MTSGDAQATRLSGGAWTLPSAISGASGATSIAIATAK
jgi:hypothetical protein